MTIYRMRTSLPSELRRGLFRLITGRSGSS